MRCGINRCISLPPVRARHREVIVSARTRADRRVKLRLSRPDRNLHHSGAPIECRLDLGIDSAIDGERLLEISVPIERDNAPRENRNVTYRELVYPLDFTARKRRKSVPDVVEIFENSGAGEAVRLQLVAIVCDDLLLYKYNLDTYFIQIIFI